MEKQYENIINYYNGKLKGIYEFTKEYEDERFNILKESTDIELIDSLGWVPGLPLNSNNIFKQELEVKEQIKDIKESVIEVNLESYGGTKDIQDTNNKEPVFILLTQTGSVVSKGIQAATGDFYTHASISFDLDMNKIYSFNVVGFVQEDLHKTYKETFGNIPIAIYSIFVNKTEVDKMKTIIEEYSKNKSKLSYNFAGIFGVLFNKPVHVNNKMFCSEFVDSILKLATIDVTGKDSGLVRPQDFKRSKIVFKIYEGHLDRYSLKRAQNNLNKLFNKNILKEMYNFKRDRLSFRLPLYNFKDKNTHLLCSNRHIVNSIVVSGIFDILISIITKKINLYTTIISSVYIYLQQGDATDFIGYNTIMKDSKDKNGNYYIENNSIISIEDGEVIDIYDNDNKNTLTGNYIVIKHSPLIYSFYAHIKNGTIKVKVGDIVQKGQKIANVGNTGNSSEPHLHFQLCIFKPEFLKIHKNFNYLIPTNTLNSIPYKFEEFESYKISYNDMLTNNIKKINKINYKNNYNNNLPYYGFVKNINESCIENYVYKLNESYIFNNKDLYINFDKFESEESNILFITGLSASGKSTLAKSLASKYKAEIIELDRFEVNHNYDERNFHRIGDIYIEYFNKRKDLREPIDRIHKMDIKEFTEEFNKFFNYILSYCNKNKDKKFIIEGLQMYRHIDSDKIKGKPSILLGTSVSASIINMFKRTIEYKEKETLKEDLLHLPTLLKWYFKHETEYTQFKKGIFKESIILQELNISQDKDKTWHCYADSPMLKGNSLGNHDDGLINYITFSKTPNLTIKDGELVTMKNVNYGDELQISEEEISQLKENYNSPSSLEKITDDNSKEFSDYEDDNNSIHKFNNIEADDDIYISQNNMGIISNDKYDIINPMLHVNGNIAVQKISKDPDSFSDDLEQLVGESRIISSNRLYYRDKNINDSIAIYANKDISKDTILGSTNSLLGNYIKKSKNNNAVIKDGNLISLRDIKKNEEITISNTDTIIQEVKEFPVQFDKDGNLIIKNIKKLDFEEEYQKSHKLLLNYDKTNNLEGMKYELSKLWFMNIELEKRIYSNNRDESRLNEYTKVRARVLNDFNKYIKVINKEENDFNFSEYYEKSPFSTSSTKINQSTLIKLGDYLKTIVKSILV